VAGGDVAQRRLGLHRDEVGVAVDRVGRLRGVGDLPDDDGSDIHRAAVGVIDLQAVGLEVADPDADPAPHRQRRHPPEPGPVDGADVVAEELDHRGLARRHDHERGADQACGAEQDPENEGVVADRDNHAGNASRKHHHPEPAVDGDRATLSDVDLGSLVSDDLGSGR
jgi:hypothetical protein